MKPFIFINTLKETDPEMARREFITRNVLFFAFIVAFFFTLISLGLYLFGKMPFDTLMIYSVVSILLFAAICLAKAGSWRLAGIIPPMLMYFPAVNANYIGGIDAPGNFMYALMIIFVAIIYGYRKMWIALVICLVTYLCLAWMISIGYIKPYRTAEVFFVNRVVLICGFLAGIALMIWLLDRSYRAEIDVRIKAEELLSRKNKELGKLNLALQESKEIYTKLIATMPDIIVRTNLNGEIVFINEIGFSLGNYEGREMIGQSMLSFIAPEDQNKAAQNTLLMFEKKLGPQEYHLVMKDGKKLLFEVNGDVLRHEDGSPYGIAHVCRDISDRRKAEEEKHSLEERLNRAEKMEVLGRMAGGVAHDLNNVLGSLIGYSELLLIEIPGGQRARDYVEKMIKATEKGAAIIQDLLTLARRGVTTSDVINLNDIVSAFLKTPVFENMKDYHPDVRFIIACQESLLNIKGSPIHLEKTLMNLLTNAAEAITEKGEVTIRTENRYLDKPIKGYDEIKEGDYVILTISDTGKGIPVEDRDKIFEPFYTKKTMSRSGTGLGLAIVWGTVKDHNGYIHVESIPGKGATFTLYFPVTREELTLPHQKVPLEQYMGNGESILIVDDMAEQRDIASGLLKKLGYTVHALPSGEEAVEYLRHHKVDILVLDMIMAPGIDGLETYQRVLEIIPKQKTIIVSGFSETHRIREAQKLGAGAYVKKPYMMENIGMAIRNELNR